MLLSTSFPYSSITHVTDMHLSKALKFLVGKDRDGILALGGPCDPEKDGGDPSENKSLINAAKRHVYDSTRIDLSSVETWVRFIEVWYQRDDFQEVTVIFLPDLSEVAPTLEQFLVQWEKKQAEVAEVAKLEKAEATKEAEAKESEKKEEEGSKDEAASASRAEAESPSEPKDETMEDDKKDEKKEDKKDEPPTEPSFYCTTHKSADSKKKCMVISLDGLLDYDETDKLEATFELSLFAESYHLMLQVFHYQSACQFLIFIVARFWISNLRRCGRIRPKRARKRGSEAKETAREREHS